MTNPTNEDRANRADLTLDSYFVYRADKRDDPLSREDVADLVTDLLHLCEREDVSIANALDTAYTNFKAESPSRMRVPEFEFFKNIDGPEFGKQREILAKIIDSCGHYDTTASEDLELLEGLRNFTDTAADYAHDFYGVNCSMTPEYLYPIEDWQLEVRRYRRVRDQRGQP